MNGQTEKQEHTLQMRDRKEMKIGGVREIVSFDEVCVVLQTVCGEMTVEGSGLRIGTFDTGNGTVALSGKIDAILYAEPEKNEKRGLLGKLFR